MATDFLIEISTEQHSSKRLISFSPEELEGIIREAGKRPVTPFIVERLLRKAGAGGILLNNKEPELYQVAKQILLQEKEICGLDGEKDHAGGERQREQDHDAMEEMDMEKKEKAPSLFLAGYNNPLPEMEQLMAGLSKQGCIPIVWNKARGLMIKHLSRRFLIFEDHDVSNLDDPEEILRFILKNPQNRLAYILEDFHHYIGNREEVGSKVGNIRSLCKELFRSLQSRRDRVYLFVPEDYDLPKDLSHFFRQIKRNRRAVYPNLEKYGQLITDPAYLSDMKPVIGVERYIIRLIQILTQMEANNPLLIGHPGVGKTAIVEGLASAVAKGSVAHQLKGKMLYSLSLNRLIAGTRYRGDFESRLEGVMDEILQFKDQIIVFIDEIHTLLDAGSAEGAMGAGDILKPVLARGQFPCIGATTFEDAKRFFRDKALARRFKKVLVNEPGEAQTCTIIKGIAHCFEIHHGVKIDDQAVKAVVELSCRHIKNEFLPGKAISLLDATAAYCKLTGQQKMSPSDILYEINQQVL